MPSNFDNQRPVAHHLQHNVTHARTWHQLLLLQAASPATDMAQAELVIFLRISLSTQVCFFPRLWCFSCRTKMFFVGVCFVLSYGNSLF